MNRLIRELLESETFSARPPVLFDIGASARLIEQWEEIAKYSIVVGFDPDDRLTGYIEKSDSRYRRLYFVPRIVTAEKQNNVEFFLTASPECSSCLEPDALSLANWNHAGFFEVEKKTALPSITIAETLKELNIDRIDGFKIDAQGCDLRIFFSIPENIRNTMLAAELEPGIMQAYKKEDKLHELLKFLEVDGRFILCDCRVQKAWYMPSSIKKNYLSPLQARLFATCCSAMPGWCETSLLAKPEQLAHDERSFQLLWIFAMLYRQYGFALQIADMGSKIFQSELYERMIRESVHAIPVLMPVARRILQKLFRIR